MRYGDTGPCACGIVMMCGAPTGSVITVDIMLSDVAQLDGGIFHTLENDGADLVPHEFERGDAMVFVSHKFHGVSGLRSGTRQVLVTELWQVQ